jgi:hypothetical protein
MTSQIKTIAGQMQEIFIYFSLAAPLKLLFLIGEGIDCRDQLLLRKKTAGYLQQTCN